MKHDLVVLLRQHLPGAPEISPLLMAMQELKLARAVLAVLES